MSNTVFPFFLFLPAVVRRLADEGGAFSLLLKFSHPSHL